MSQKVHRGSRDEEESPNVSELVGLCLYRCR